MDIHAGIAGLREDLARQRRQGRSVGLVPTMGALHRGHASLIERATAENDVVVVSSFVNPTQFGPGEDFSQYPRTPEADVALAEAAGATHLFAPGPEEMYPSGRPPTAVSVGPIGDVGEGAWRPGHFDAVATVCVKLVAITGPDRAYFGQKDAQQLAVIRQVVRDLDLPLAIVGCPTVRDADGLALSSRNAYLSPEARAVAPAFAQALNAAREAGRSGERDAAVLRAVVAAALAPTALTLQYVDVFDAGAFLPVECLDAPAILAGAAFLEGTRLIDNVELVPAPARQARAAVGR